MNYLGFDSSKLTAAQLRNILNKHNIQYSSSAPKSSLVELFKLEIAPKANKLRKEYNEKVKNSNDEGFVNAVDEQKEVTVTKEKSKANKTNETAEEQEPSLEIPKARTKKTSVKSTTTSRKSSSKTKSPEIGDTDDESNSSRPTRNRNKGNPELNSLFDLDDSVLQVRKTSTKSKKTKSRSTKSPEVVKEKTVLKSEPIKESKEDKASSPEPKEETSFSKENVFQSPSSSSSKKRKHQEDEKESLVRKRTVSSTKKLKHRDTPSTVERSIVKDVDDEDSDLELYERFLKTEDFSRDDSTSTIVTPLKLKSTKSRSTSSTFKVSKPKAKSTSRKATPSKVIKSSPTSSKDESFRTIKDEIPPGVNYKQVDPEMAKLLGITIQGFQPPVIATPLKEELTEKKQLQQGDSTPLVKRKTPERISTSKTASSKVSTPTSSKGKEPPISSRKSISSSAKKSALSSSKNSTPQRQSPLIRKSALTPKPRLLSLGSQKYETDSEEDEDDSVVNVTKTLEADTSDITSRRSSLSVSKFIGSMFLWILVVSTGLFGLWYYEQKYSVGYCGQEIDQLTFADTDNIYLESIGKFLDDNFKPSCISCPKYSRCHPNLNLSCMENFMEYKPWYDFIIPGHKKCIPDTKKAEKLEIMIDVALDLLRSKNAAFHCGLGTDDEECGIKLDDLHDLLLSIKAPYITLDEFEELWEKSVIELEKEPDIVIRQVR